MLTHVLLQKSNPKLLTEAKIMLMVTPIPPDGGLKSRYQSPSFPDVKSSASITLPPLLPEEKDDSL